MDSARLQPALFGGLFIGLLSALPFVKYGNACCCLWVLLGGVIAVWLAQSNQTEPIKVADGLMLGIAAGVVGAVVALPVNMVFEEWERGLMLRFVDSMNADIPPDLRAAVESATSSVGGRVLGFVYSLIVNVIFGMLGGLLGVAVFKRNSPPQPPQPPMVIPHDPGVAH